MTAIIMLCYQLLLDNIPPFYNQQDNFRNNHNIKRTKSKKKQQQDQDRLNIFRERKAVYVHCSHFLQYMMMNFTS